MTLCTQISNAIDSMGSQQFIDDKISIKLSCNVAIALVAVVDRTLDEKAIHYLRFQNYNPNIVSNTPNVAGLKIIKTDFNSQDNQLNPVFLERLKTTSKVYLRTLAANWKKCSEEDRYYAKEAASDEIRCNNIFNVDLSEFEVFHHDRVDMYGRMSMLEHIATKGDFKGKVIITGCGYHMVGKEQDLEAFVKVVKEECLDEQIVT